MGYVPANLRRPGEVLSEEVARWRLAVFLHAQVFAAIDVATYICGVVVITVLEICEREDQSGSMAFPGLEVP